MEMELPDNAESSKNKNLNRLVAVTVLLLSVAMGIAKIKDDNIVQAMQQTKADAVDTWNEYQAKSIKQHIDNTTLLNARLMKVAPEGEAAKQLAQVADEAKHYTSRLKELGDKAKSMQSTYDKLGYRDDQFDLADALLSIALGVSGMAILAETFWLLAVSWVSGGLGLSFVIAGFAGLPWHPDAIIAFLT